MASWSRRAAIAAPWSSDELPEDEEGEDEEENMFDTKGRSPRDPKSKSTKSSKKPPQSSSEDEGEEEESWGRKKSVFYSSNAAQLDSDDEEGHEMEEQEARRLQAKLREPLREDDFGFNEALQTSLDSKDSE